MTSAVFSALPLPLLHRNLYPFPLVLVLLLFHWTSCKQISTQHLFNSLTLTFLTTYQNWKKILAKRTINFHKYTINAELNNLAKTKRLALKKNWLTGTETEPCVKECVSEANFNPFWNEGGGFHLWLFCDNCFSGELSFKLFHRLLVFRNIKDSMKIWIIQRHWKILFRT